MRAGRLAVDNMSAPAPHVKSVSPLKTISVKDVINFENSNDVHNSEVTLPNELQVYMEDIQSEEGKCRLFIYSKNHV